MSREHLGAPSAASPRSGVFDHIATSPAANVTVGVTLLVFVVAWVLYGTASHTGIALHDDVTEAYVWGRQFRLGYNQHPPFWAWIAGVWFYVFPNRDWAFMLLAVVNSAVGLLGAWHLIGKFAQGPTRMAAWLLLLCTPFYTFNCFKYNANSIFLSIWPWTLLFFIRALETRRARDGILFGVMIGVAMLSKYYAVILVVTCLTASMLHADARAYWRSWSPWVAIAVASALILPHAVWLVVNDAPPVQYALARTGMSFPARAAQDAKILLATAGVQALIPMLVVLTRRRMPGWAAAHDLRFLAVLVLLPSVLTIACGLFLGIQLSAAMLIGTFPLAPLLVIRAIPRADPVRLLRWTSGVVVAATLISLASIPVTIRMLHRPTDASWQLPLEETSAAVSALWRETTDRPLGTVGGSKYFSNAAAFYNDDRPSGFLELDFGLAPWVTPDTLRAGGLVAICLREAGPADDAKCRDNAARLATPRTKVTQLQLTHRVLGAVRGTSTLDVYITAPEP